jgi:DNA-binding CsgD family transcriptional regulator
MNGLSLGIPGAGQVSSGTHLCALYAGRAERDRLLFPFLEEGLRHRDKVLCLVDDVEPATVRDRVMGRPGPEHVRRSAQLDVGRASDAYLRAGAFDAGLMIQSLAKRVEATVAADVGLLRAVGEMSWVMPRVAGTDDLFVYESALNRVVSQAPAIFMCLYDLTTFGADMLVEVLHTHPTVLLDRSVIVNPYFVDPAEYLSVRGGDPATRHPVVTVDMDGDEGVGDGWGSLTHAELRVASHVSRGMTNRMIAADLYVSHHTVDAHLKHIYLKLQIHSRVELTVLALHHRLATG